MDALNQQGITYCKAMVGLGLAGSGLGLLFLFGGKWHIVIGGGVFLFVCLWFALIHAALAQQPHGVDGWRKAIVPFFIEKAIHEHLLGANHRTSNRRDAWKRIVFFSVIAGFIAGALFPVSPVLAVGCIVVLAILTEVVGRHLAKRGAK